MKGVISIIFSLLIVGFGNAQNKQTQIKWKKLRTEKEVMVELKKHIEVGASETEVKLFLESQKLERYGKNENYYFAYAKTKSKSIWIAKEWFIKFHLGEGGSLTSINIEAALTGP